MAYNLPPNVTLADIDREAGVYDPIADEFYCRLCGLEIAAGPDGVPDDEDGICTDCRTDIEAGTW